MGTGKQRLLRLAGSVAKHLPSDRARIFSFVASPSVRAEPWSLYQRLHVRGPVRPGPMGSWIVASHEGVSTILRHAGTSVDESRAVGMEHFDRSDPFTTLMDRTLLFTDPPDHHRLRRLVSKAFTPSRIAELEQPTRCLADQLLADLRPRGTGDLIAEFALPFPVAVITELLGIAAEDRTQFLGWARDFAPRLDVSLFRDEGTERRGARAAVQFAAYIGELLDDPNRRDPGGLVAALADAQRDDDGLEREEIVALCALLLVAGFETTTNLVANSLHALAARPDQRALLTGGDVSVDVAVEELLRFAGPVQFTQRVVLEDVVVDGHEIPAGTLVALLIGAANRDPSVFVDPDRLDLTRDPNPHLSFSFGIHHCLGAALARLEAAVAVPAVLRALPGLRLDPDPPWRETFVLRGLERLPATWST